MKPLLSHSDARAALLAGLLSLTLLCGAWFFEYVLGYAPCIMCYWQRHAHMAVIGVSAVVVASRAVFGEGPAGRARGLPIWLGPTLLILLLLFSAGLGAFHVGVEFGWWDGPAACAAANLGQLGEVDPNDPLAFLDSVEGGVSCADVAWSLLGISMAGWNALISLLGVFGVWYLGIRKAGKA